jgi:two-component system, OmpR family, KDP operon response regulator KdpE
VSDPRSNALVVEDEPAMRRFLRATLTTHGYVVREAGTATDGLALATQYPPDVVLLDLGLPDRDGMEVTRALREWSNAPIIVLSARGRDDDKVGALDAGADDYLTKPFSVNELLARLRVALRHASRPSVPGDPVIRSGALALDAARHEVRVRGELVKLTPIEFRLLHYLAKHAGRVLTHRQILREIWGPNAAGQSHYLRVYMTHLRKKLERDPARPDLLLNEPGVGYRLAEIEPEPR